MWGEHLAMQLLWTIARLLVTRVTLIYLVDKFFFLFLVYLNKMITLGESKVLFVFSGVKQGNERGRLVQNFLVLTQGFGSFPTVFSQGKWRNFARVECLWMNGCWFLFCCKLMLLWLMGFGFENTDTFSRIWNVARVIPRLYGWVYKILRLTQLLDEL